MDDDKKEEHHLSKYEDRFCQMVIEDMKGGDSIEAFCCKIGIGPDTFITWRKKRRAFSEAVDIAQAHAKVWYENLAKRILLGQSVSVPNGQTLLPKDFNTKLYEIVYRNRFGDPKKQVELTGAEGKPIETKNHLTVTIKDAREE